MTGKPATDRNHAATAIIEDAPGGGAFLAVKVCAEDERTAGLWDESTLQCALARDLTVASGGVPGDLQGPYFTARFESIQAATLASRRLQWGLQGFSDSAGAPSALTILIQSGEDVMRSGFDTRILDEAAGARILVAESAAKFLEEIPGLPLSPAEDGQQGGVRELSWRAADGRTTRDADEQALAHFIEQSGRAVYPAPAEAVPAVSAATVSTAEFLARPYDEDEDRPKSRKGLWIGLAAAVVVAIAGAVLYFQFGSGEKKAAPATQEATSAASESPASPQPTRPSGTVTSPSTNSDATQGGTAANAQPEHLTKAQRREQERKQKQLDAQAKTQGQTPATATEPAQQPQPPPQETKKPEPTQVSGSCQYSSDQIPGLISLAESSRARRNYKEAQRRLQAVIQCQPGNAKAREELELVRQAQAAEGGSSDEQ